MRLFRDWEKSEMIVVNFNLKAGVMGKHCHYFVAAELPIEKEH